MAITPSSPAYLLGLAVDALFILYNVIIHCCTALCHQRSDFECNQISANQYRMYQILSIYILFPSILIQSIKPIMFLAVTLNASYCCPHHKMILHRLLTRAGARALH